MVQLVLAAVFGGLFVLLVRGSIVEHRRRTCRHKHLRPVAFLRTPSGDGTDRADTALLGCQSCHEFDQLSIATIQRHIDGIDSERARVRRRMASELQDLRTKLVDARRQLSDAQAQHIADGYVALAKLMSVEDRLTKLRTTVSEALDDERHEFSGDLLCLALEEECEAAARLRDFTPDEARAYVDNRMARIAPTGG